MTMTAKLISYSIENIDEERKRGLLSLQINGSPTYSAPSLTLCSYKMMHLNNQLATYKVVANTANTAGKGKSTSYACKECFLHLMSAAFEYATPPMMILYSKRRIL